MSTGPTRIAVLGAGSWGTALAILLARNGAQVTLWGRDPATMAEMVRGMDMGWNGSADMGRGS